MYHTAFTGGDVVPKCYEIYIIRNNSDNALYIWPMSIEYDKPVDIIGLALRYISFSYAGLDDISSQPGRDFNA